MGSKIGSKELMRAGGVPTLPSVTVEGDDLPDVVAVEELGWPLSSRRRPAEAVVGCGWCGGRSEPAEAIIGARREAEAAFGDGSVFLERYLPRSRHIEVQVLADAYGDTVALFERECSIQRRHQKMIEEAPSPAVTPQLGPAWWRRRWPPPARSAMSTPAPSSSSWTKQASPSSSR